jgi:AcrR family transcriptional regulator
MPQTDPEADEQDQSVRQRLLDAACELFTEKGYASTSVREIVERAGVTKPMLYYHFGNKEGIYLALVNESYQELGKMVRESLDFKGDVRQRLLRMTENVFDLFHANQREVRFIHSMYYGPSGGAPEADLEAFHMVLHEAVATLVTEGIADGEFRPGDPDEITLALTGALHMAMEVELNHPQLQLGRAGLLRVINLVFNGIAVQRQDGGE